MDNEDSTALYRSHKVSQACSANQSHAACSSCDTIGGFGSSSGVAVGKPAGLFLATQRLATRASFQS